MNDSTPSRTNLYGLELPAIAALPELAGQPGFRALQIARWLYERGGNDFAEMTDLSKELRARLAEKRRIGRIRPVEEAAAEDGGTTKYLFLLEDGKTVEAVWIRDRVRDTLCISSQAGCAYGCTFCATASMRAGRNLTTGEILGQIAGLREEVSRRGSSASANIVFMGMGEPLANFESVVAALRLICGDPGFGIAPRRVTVSTVGLEPEIRRLAREALPVRLAFSLNATTDEVRSKLMPVNRKYPFRKVFDALREYQRIRKSRITIEYVLLKGINDAEADAQRLARFARSLECRVNLIAYNPHRFAAYLPVSDEEIDRFRKAMLPIAPSVTITVRWSKGREIQAACGQLATSQRDETIEPALS